MTGSKRLSTRRMILNILKTERWQSIADMAQQLELTDMAIRRHLNVMEQERLVSFRLVRQPVGRPLKQYCLTPRAEALFPTNYQSLALDLLDEIGKEERSKIKQLFEKRMERLRVKYAPRMQGKNLTERVDVLTHIQNAGGYMAEWEEQGDGSYMLKEFNCPISQVADVYDEACECELKLFRNLLEAGVERTECLAKDGNKCTYVIRSEG